MKPLLWTTLATVLLIASASYAQDEPYSKAPKVSMSAAPLVTIVQAKSGTVPLMFHVASGFHINSNKPKSEFLIPTTLKVDATTDIMIGKVTYPEGKDLAFAFAPDEKLNVYTGDFQIGVMVHPLTSVVKGKYMVRGTLKYQACDNAACYPPKTLPINFEVKVAKAAPPSRPNPAQSPHKQR